MAKQTGLGDNFYIGGYDLSGDVAALTTAALRNGLLDMTAINKSARERVYGLASGEISFNAFFDDDTGKTHDALKGLPKTDRIVMWFRGTTLGNQSASMVAKQINYDWNRTADMGLIGTVQCLNNPNAATDDAALQFTRSITAGIRADTTATNGTGIDDGATTNYGIAAYLQVFEFTGTSATVKFQESTDDGSTDAYADVTGGAFTAVTAAPDEEFIETGRTLAVEQWLRVVTTGTFSNLKFAVTYFRYEE